uniref:Selenoprotein H n=1 Tax=Oreochromis aureus TaxID=47969 RepID=A0A668RF78_OREAU
SGRRGRKRKAEAEEQQTPAEKKKERGEEEGKRVVIEHWDNAEEVKSALLAACPALHVILNPEKPRKKSFDITLMDGDKETCLWTGIKKGPPARLKFPQPDVVVAALQEALKAEQMPKFVKAVAHKTSTTD